MTLPAETLPQPTGTEERLRELKNAKRHLPHSTLKLAAIETLAVLLSGAAGYCYLLYLAGHARAGFFIAALGAFFAVSFLGTLFAPSLRHRAAIILLETAAFLSFFYDMKATVLSIAFAVMIVFSLWGERHSRNDTANMVQFRFLRSARLKMAKLFTGILLGAMILFFPQWQEANVFISEGRFERYYTGVAERLNRVYAKLDFTDPIGEFARSLARTNLEGDPRFRELPPDLQDRAFDAAAGEFIATAERNLDIDITSEMTLGQVIYRYLANLLEGWRTKFGDSFLVLSAVTIFVLARGAGAVFIWITLYAAYFFYKALVAWEVIGVTEETKTQERPILA